MPSESESSAPAASMTPRVFCKKCGYALVGLPSRKCPECGRGFDLQDPRTFARRPPRGWVWRWGRRLLVSTLLLLLAAGAGIYWLWRGWQAEQPAIAQLRATGQRFHVAPNVPQRLRWVLGERLGYLTDRMDWVQLDGLKAVETEQLDLRSLTQVEELWLDHCELSNRNLHSLADLTKLKHLGLYDLKIETPDLAFLEKLSALSTLVLKGEWLSSAGYRPIGRLGHLEVLYLIDTGTTDADLQHLRSLPALEQLFLKYNPITDAGLEHLQGLKSLKRLWVDRRLVDSPSITKLKQAIPGLQVDGF